MYKFLLRHKKKQIRPPRGQRPTDIHRFTPFFSAVIHQGIYIFFLCNILNRICVEVQVSVVMQQNVRLALTHSKGTKVAKGAKGAKGTTCGKGGMIWRPYIGNIEAMTEWQNDRQTDWISTCRLDPFGRRGWAKTAPGPQWVVAQRYPGSHILPGFSSKGLFYVLFFSNILQVLLGVDMTLKP